ncbi:RluA family pseudouridine synthase [Campylobacter sp. MIT 99-7217]|uniref:RluA family pseudouridine synthase n=1 Tax=Campylobacter sp. MIT 99-7217 TaxID=535091 RepID=UPI00115B34C0|nr:RluA family pseudouridine synthase [Campylobacter sp. MIT 99-7217]TQR33769.1 RluA family pseudouridine synthase [Campylobacter sp. MIT 99-7217]
MQKFLVHTPCRLDVFLAQSLNQSRNQVSLLIKDECIKVNSILQNKTSFKLKENDEVEVIFKEKSQIQNNFEINFDIEVLFEDEDLLVINKPPCLVVHGASSVKEATLVDWLLSKNYALSSLNGLQRAGLIHRLDKETSGALIIAKNNTSHQILSKQLQDKSMGRYYLALIDLALKEDKLVVEKALARAINHRIKKTALEKARSSSGIKHAKSAFINLLSQEQKEPNLIAAKLFTGRTHQIRAHLESLNRHILGDELYGYRGKFKTRVMLHAYFVYFLHPKTQEKYIIKAPIYDDFNTILHKYFTQGEIDEKTSLSFIEQCFDTFV